MNLKYLVYKLRKENEEKANCLLQELRNGGVDCRRFDGSRIRKGEAGQTLIFTDDRDLAQYAGGEGVSCVAAASLDEPFFEGAGMVLERFDDVDYRFLEEFLLRDQGLPVTISRTEHLILRELEEKNIPELCKLIEAEKDGYVMNIPGEWNGFDGRNLSSYIRHRYCLSGYGIWGVFLKLQPERRTSGRESERKAERLIGCCGFEPMLDADCEGAEMEFLLAKEFRGRGLGTEMCRSALDYLAERTDETQAWVRIHPENTGAVKFAGKLGFHRPERYDSSDGRMSSEEDVIRLVMEVTGDAV